MITVGEEAVSGVRTNYPSGDRRVRIFVDFWNFQLAWNDHVHPQASSPRNHVRIAWEVMPTTFMSELPAALGGSAGQGFSFKGVNVYASVNPQPGSKSDGWKKASTPSW